MENEDEMRAGELFRAGPRHALAWIDEGGNERRRLFVSVWDLALALRALRDPGAAKARGPEGERLDVRELLEAGRSMSSGRRARRFSLSLGLFQCGGDDSARAGHQTRWGPVPGVRARRGGGGCHRRMRTQQERAWAQSVEAEEPAPRAKRGARTLPNAWDDYMIQRENGWKRQRRGRKAWERAGREPAGDRRAFAEFAWGAEDGQDFDERGEGLGGAECD